MRLSKRVLPLIIPGLVLLLFAISTPAQWEKKKYTEWTEKDATKVLNDSPWGRTLTFTSPMEQFRRAATGAGGNSAPTAPPQALQLNFRVRFLSAKPIRQALARIIEVKSKGAIKEDVAEQLKQFSSGEFLEIIVVAVTADSVDTGSNVNQALALLSQGSTAKFTNNAFLEIKGGKRIFLQEYQPPRPDGFGARFIFQRLVEDKPFITMESEEIHFFAELSGQYKLDRRFKTKDMMYEGKLEY
jgi:hypothetical protein